MKNRSSMQSVHYYVLKNEPNPMGWQLQIYPLVFHFLHPPPYQPPFFPSFIHSLTHIEAVSCTNDRLAFCMFGVNK